MFLKNEIGRDFSRRHFKSVYKRKEILDQDEQKIANKFQENYGSFQKFYEANHPYYIEN